MNEMLTETVQIPNTEFMSSTPQMSPRSPQGQILSSARGNYSSNRSLSANRAEKSTAAGATGLGRTRSLSLPPDGSALLTRTRILQKKVPASRGRKTVGTSSNAQSRPVSSLPRNHISQTAQRKILTDPRKPRSHTQGHVKLQQCHIKRVPAVQNQAFQCSSPIQRPNVQRYKRQTQAGVDVLSEEEDELESVWSPPDEIRRILDKSNDTLSQHENGEHAFSVLNAEGIDDISDSTGSILSKIDWNAIENLVANVNET
ncbi:ciliogenesis and planar polarity effector 1-like [Protopterus annectens]|uniref:ciliogenesis and planar polarity effector 1-like n=1 Tax=Protopterus annectens TaxID=7888 RepID=UPI001CF9D5AE|nr:ciliogenesis and planar polarity effector 1-like [Protopterus annectens]